MSRASVALNKSIAHWARLLCHCVEEDKEALIEEGWVAENCALCEEYIVDDDGEKDCIGCPVMKDTGSRHCFYTPYYEASKALEDLTTYSSSITSWKDATKLVRKELDFLRMLGEKSDVSG